MVKKKGRKREKMNPRWTWSEEPEQFRLSWSYSHPREWVFFSMVQKYTGNRSHKNGLESKASCFDMRGRTPSCALLTGQYSTLVKTLETDWQVLQSLFFAQDIYWAVGHRTVSSTPHSLDILIWIYFLVWF